MTSVDKIYKGYAEEYFGKECVERCLTDEQIEESRVYAFRTHSEMMEKLSQEDARKLLDEWKANGVEPIKDLFLNHIFSEYI